MINEEVFVFKLHFIPEKGMFVEDIIRGRICHLEVSKYVEFVIVKTLTCEFIEAPLENLIAGESVALLDEAWELFALNYKRSGKCELYLSDDMKQKIDLELLEI